MWLRESHHLCGLHFLIYKLRYLDLISSSDLSKRGLALGPFLDLPGHSLSSPTSNGVERPWGQGNLEPTFYTCSSHFEPLGPSNSQIVIILLWVHFLNGGTLPIMYILSLKSRQETAVDEPWVDELSCIQTKILAVRWGRGYYSSFSHAATFSHWTQQLENSRFKFGCCKGGLVKVGAQNILFTICYFDLQLLNI